MIGYVSQLCHAIAVSLMCANDNTSLCEYTGDSFRDLTRIARINDKMWAELFLWNKENLISEIDQFSGALNEMRNALVADDREKLEEMFRLSTQRRAALIRRLRNLLSHRFAVPVVFSALACHLPRPGEMSRSDRGRMLGRPGKFAQNAWVYSVVKEWALLCSVRRIYA